MIKCDILIPAYNAAATIAELLQELDHLKISLREVIVVNDGSTDATATIAREYGATVLDHDANKGKGAALRTGFANFLESDCTHLVCMDADLQHPPQFVPKLISTAVGENCDLLIGNRAMDWRSMPLARIASNRITSFVMSMISGQKIKDSQSGFRVFHRRVLETLSTMEDGFQMESEMILKAAKAGFKIGFLQIPTIYRAGGTSHIAHVSDTLKFIRLIFKSMVKRNDAVRKSS